MKQNVAGQSIGAEMITIADGSNFTGSVSVLVTIDNGTQTAGAGTSPAHKGNGFHSYEPTQAETNGLKIDFLFVAAGALTASREVFTTFPQSVDNATGIASNNSAIGALNNLDSAATQAAANAALVANHLDHIFAVDYNPNSKPGVATALFNELIQSAGGVPQFTATALEQGSSDTNIVFDGVTNSGSSDITIVLENSASNQDNFYRHESVIVDGENRLALAYSGSLRTLVLDAPLINGAPSNNTPIIIMGGSRVFTAAQRLGYTDDKVFINAGGESGTILEVNGIEDGPVDNIADATVIAAAHSPAITKFDLASGTTVTPTQTYTNWQWLGRAATINFNNQQYPNNTFERHFLGGVINASTASQYRVISSQITSALTTPMNAVFVDSGIFADITFNATGQFVMSDCNNINAITIDMGAAIATGSAFIADHNGDVTYSNITGSQIITHYGTGSVILDASCTGGTFIYGGDIQLTNNGSTTSTASTLDSIDSRIPAALVNGNINANMQAINDVDLVGDGSGTPFEV